MPFFPHPLRKLIPALAASLMLVPTVARPAAAEAVLLIEADTGKVLHAEQATYPWYPASVTKLMTAYVTLRAVKERRLALDTLLAVSPNALAQAPSKMGFRVGTQVTVDNALKMLMVKSANDIAVVLAEGVAGSIEKFADEMNLASRRLGMTQSTWVNPNGLPADDQITSARDMAILARAILREFPEYEHYWSIPAIKFGRRVMRNTNGLIGRYPDANGMKTGFICASGFNVVASATRNGKRLIAVVMGAPSGMIRSEKAAQLFEKGFNGGGLSWLMPSLGTVDALQPIAAAPPNLREDMCGKHRKRPAAEVEDETTATNDIDPSSAFAVMSQGWRRTGPVLGPYAAAPPVDVWVGLKKKPGSEVAALEPAKKRAAKGRKPKESVKPGRKPAVQTATTDKTPDKKPASPGFTATPAAPPAGAFTPAAKETKPTKPAKPAATTPKPAKTAVADPASAKKKKKQPQ